MVVLYTRYFVAKVNIMFGTRSYFSAHLVVEKTEGKLNENLTSFDEI